MKHGDKRVIKITAQGVEDHKHNHELHILECEGYKKQGQKEEQQGKSMWHTNWILYVWLIKISTPSQSILRQLGSRRITEWVIKEGRRVSVGIIDGYNPELYTAADSQEGEFSLTLKLLYKQDKWNLSLQLYTIGMIYKLDNDSKKN